MKLPLEGECLCSATRFRLKGEPLFTHACHCLDCQKRSGSAFSMSTLVLESDLEMISGETVIHPKTKTGKYQLLICFDCQTRLWLRKGSSRVLIVRSGVLTNASDIRPQAHIYAHRKQQWLKLEADVPRFDGDYDQTSTWPASSLARLAE